MFGLGDAIGIHVHLEAQKRQLHALGGEIREGVVVGLVCGGGSSGIVEVAQRQQGRRDHARHP